MLCMKVTDADKSNFETYVRYLNSGTDYLNSGTDYRNIIYSLFQTCAKETNKKIKKWNRGIKWFNSNNLGGKVSKWSIYIRKYPKKELTS